MKKICLFSGTSEGRELAFSLARYEAELTVCTATGYGGSLSASPRARVCAGEMDCSEMERFFEREKFDCVIDATHPHARAVTQNIRDAASAANVKCFRVLRGLPAPDSDAVGHYVEIGAADMYYSDISDGNILRMSGKKVNINLNHLIYIGANLSDEQLSLNALRLAISSGLDRKEICRDGYFNNALPANGFFNPAWEAVKSVQNINLQANKEITVENLEEIGYNKLDGEGVRTNSAGKKLKFELLVNKENRLRVSAAKIIASRLSEYGISVRVAEKSFADYTAALSSGNFQLYLAEVAITPNMDISSLVTEGGSAAYGIKTANKNNADGKTEPAADTLGNQQTEEKSLTAAELVNGFYAGTNTLADLASVLQTEMPVIPICYRTGVLFYNDKIENVNNSSCSDIYFSIDSYSVVS